MDRYWTDGKDKCHTQNPELSRELPRIDIVDVMDNDSRTIGLVGH